MNFKIGSMWRKWDLHIHTPASVLNNQFGNNWEHYIHKLFKKAISEKIYAIGITDYFSIEGYKKVEEYLSNEKELNRIFKDELENDSNYIDKIKNILILPNIELRLDKTVEVYPKRKNSKIQLHVLFSNELQAVEIEDNFLHLLKFKDGLSEKSLTDVNIVNYGHQLKTVNGIGENESARTTGYKNISVDEHEVYNLLNNNFKDKALIIGVEEDVTKINWHDQCGGIRRTIYKLCDAFFTSNNKSIKWFGSDDAVATIDERKACLWGSDAHEISKLFKPELERYCWIKSDTTFEGLKEAIHSINERIYIGEVPPEYQDALKRTNYSLRSIEIVKKKESKSNKTWFNFDEPLCLNPYMISIIGNKGSGKSALADIIAYLSNSHKIGKASFLNKNRFLNPSTKYGNDYIVGISFFGNCPNIQKLFIDNSYEEDKPEKIQFLPQSYIEEVCNDLGEKFQEEINNVIFSYIPAENKLDCNNLNELIFKKSTIIEQKRQNYRNEIENLNQEIIMLEEKMSDSYKNKISNALQVQKDKLTNHENNKPTKVDKPDELEQDTYSKLDIDISNEIKEIESTIDSYREKIKNINESIYKITNIQKEKDFLIDKCNNVNELYAILLKELNITSDEQFINVVINETIINKELNNLMQQLKEINELISTNEPDDNIDVSITKELNLNKIMQSVNCKKSLCDRVRILEKYKQIISEKADEKIKKYLNYQNAMKKWEYDKSIILGEKQEPGVFESIKKYDDELKYIENKLQNELNEKLNNRANIAKNIFNLYLDELNVLEEIYSPIQEKIDDIMSYDKENIKFSTNISYSKNIISKLMNSIDQRIKGPLSSINNGINKLNELFEEVDFNDYQNVETFINKFYELVNDYNSNYIKNKKEFYNDFYKLEYLDTNFQLSLGNRKLKELSPGERGIVLLIFYLTLDKSNYPLIIDQPEDNLDNQSVFVRLVPCIKEAKKRRQIIVVTHNPNIAVACDSEQIIYSEMDKKTYEIKYESGSIENPKMKEKIIDILEGTKPAFDLRKFKYN